MSVFTDHSAHSLHPGEDEVPIATLERLSLSKLLTGDADTSSRLFTACKTVGFLSIDLQDHEEGRTLTKLADDMFKLAHEVFDLDVEEKKTFTQRRDRPLVGYKEVGLTKLDKKGTPDRVESFGISKDDILHQSPPGIAFPEPAPVQSYRDKIKTFMLRCHSLTDLISSHLERQLGLPQGALVVRQRLQAISGNLLRLTRTAAPKDQKDVSLNPHTDLGCVTVLFNIIGGLQVLTPGGDPYKPDDWKYVRPQPGCVIINLGDAMVKWSNGILRSNIHRVAFPPGKQAHLTRYSLAYFSRAESNARMEALDGTVGEGGGQALTAAEWERDKAIAIFRDPTTLRSLGGVTS